MALSAKLPGMKLKDYLDGQGVTYEAFAGLIGVTTKAAWRYAHGERVPRPAIMHRIVEATGGAVQPQDFYDQNADAA